MPQWIQDLTTGWPLIWANLPTFAVIIALVIGVVWWLMEWRYGGVIAQRDGAINNRDSEIALLKGQRDDYKEKLSGATPDQAKARIDALEERLARLEPRRLSASQRAVLVSNVRHAGSFRLSLVSEMGSDSQQYAADFAAVFREAGTWVLSEGAVMGIGNRPPSGIAVRFADLNQPPAEAAILISALRAANVQFDIGQQHLMDGMPVEILICMRTQL